MPTLKKQAERIAGLINSESDDPTEEPHGVRGVVEVNNGLVYTGSSQVYHVRQQELLRYGIKADDVARTLNIALLGETASSVLEGDRADQRSLAGRSEVRQERRGHRRPAGARRNGRIGHAAESPWPSAASKPGSWSCAAKTCGRTWP